MTRRSSLAVVLVCGVAASRWVSSAQTPTAGAPFPLAPIATSGADTPARTVRVDALVTDKHGKPVVNLRATDFQIIENGIEQKIETAELRSRSGSSPAAAGGIETREDEERAAHEADTRTFALYLDEFHVAAGSNTERVKEAASRFVDERVRPNDLLVVMKPLDHLNEFRFLRDRADARQAISTFEGRKDDYTPRTPFEEQYMGRSAAAVRAARAQIVISGLRALAARIGDLDAGLSAIVLVSEGFTAEFPGSREQRLPDLQGLGRMASRNRVLFYAFDPALTTAPEPAPAQGASDDDRASRGSMGSFETLAQQTGGLSVAPGQDLAPAFEGVSRDLDSYYVLTYKSTTVSDGRFHKLQVTSTRRDTQVRARAGYWAPMPVELRTTRAATMPLMTPMRAVRRSPLIESWVGVMIEPGGQRRIIFTWTPSALPARPAKPVGRPDIVTLKVTTPAGTVLYEGDLVAARSGAVSSVRNDSAVFTASTGRLQFDLTILQADGTRLDVGTQDYDVPEVKTGNPVILPPQLFRAASARELREITADANAAPLPGRDFRRTDTMILRVPTFDPAGARVQVSAKLMNRVGTVLTELTPLSEEADTRLSQFDLPLARFAPGEYSIEVAAQSESGLARELIRVRITG